MSLSLLTLLHVSLFADDAPPDRAMLHSSGMVLVNQGSAPGSMAIFAGDEVETRPGSSARIEYVGSSVDISPETLVHFESGEIILEHGSVIVTSFRQLRVRAGCVLATPVAAEKTIYFVKDTDNRVTVNAQERDVKLDSHSDSIKRASLQKSSTPEIVHQGEQKSREEHCGAGDPRNSAPQTAATDGILDSPYAVGGAGLVVTGGTLCIVFCFTDDPASPWSPSKSSITTNHP
jgi:hypothetical protein